MNFMFLQYVKGTPHFICIYFLSYLIEELESAEQDNNKSLQDIIVVKPWLKG